MAYTPPEGDVYFDFIESGYTAPGGLTMSFSFSSDVSALYQLSPDVAGGNYLYAATDIGLIVIDIDTEAEYARAVNNTTTSVWNDEDNIYIGTTVSGIYYLEKDYITSLSGGNLTDYLSIWKQTPFLSSNYIKYLHGSGDYLCVSTAAGFDFIWISLDDIESAMVTMSWKCFVCSDGKTYFTTSGTPNMIYRANVPGSIAYPATEYICGSGYLEDVANANDIFVTENTSSAAPILWVENTLFIAASGGAYVFDEGTKVVHKYLLEGSS
jgi:hypothetical protein